MQHTDKYKFNLIETSDTFSPEALNENAEAVETELARVEAAHAAGKAELEGKLSNHETRIASMEVHRMVVGSYAGNGGTQTIEVGFRPVAVIIFPHKINMGGMAMAVAGSDVIEHPNGNPVLTIVDNGFRVDNPSPTATVNFNSALTYHYLAVC